MAAYKTCTKCTGWRPLIDFAPRKWHPDGTIRYLQSYCRHCQKLWSYKYWRESPQHVKDRNRELNREQMVAKSRERGIPPRPVGPFNKGEYGAGRVASRIHANHYPGEQLPVSIVKPYVERLVAHAAHYSIAINVGGVRILSEWTGVDEALIHRILKEAKPHVSTDVVDQLLLHSDIPFTEIMDAVELARVEGERAA